MPVIISEGQARGKFGRVHITSLQIIQLKNNNVKVESFSKRTLSARSVVPTVARSAAERIFVAAAVCDKLQISLSELGGGFPFRSFCREGSV